MLPKPISVETVSGLRTIAEEGIPLPFGPCALTLRTVQELTEIPIACSRRTSSSATLS